jgi:hypothetical protein
MPIYYLMIKNEMIYFKRTIKPIPLPDLKKNVKELRAVIN